ncbi:MAG TPA: reverse transcriptase domain-containing protein [Methylomirabilota bacterium]|nr:reverse transcriptase domain-containing protein [Methylomirabilota bacterium]
MISTSDTDMGRPNIYSSEINSNINRQLLMMQRRLRYMVSEGRNDHYWSFSSLMLRKSKSLRMLALRNVRPNWYKDMSIKKLMETLSSLNGMCYRPRQAYEIQRVGIPKDDGSKRFINAPKLEVRLYLWMMNFFLGLFLETKLNPNQYGHRHGRGAADAWRKLLKEQSQYRHIYEFDFKGFHDEIRRDFLVKALRNLGVSEE